MSLILPELTRIIGRRGSFFGVMAVALVIAALAAWLGPDGSQSGEAWAQIIGIPLVFGATVVGALEGSYDMAQGTMRYLVLTGVPRWKLMLVRVPALIIAILLIAAPAVLVGAAAMLADGESTSAALHGIGNALVVAGSWGIVAMAVGTLLRSNGAGIAVALVFYLAANIITAVVRSQVSETAGDYLLPNLIDVVARLGASPYENEFDPSSMALGTAVVALIAWFAAIIGLATARVQRDEY